MKLKTNFHFLWSSGCFDTCKKLTFLYIQLAFIPARCYSVYKEDDRFVLDGRSKFSFRPSSRTVLFYFLLL